MSVRFAPGTADDWPAFERDKLSLSNALIPVADALVITV
jgi:hypothetical protein